MKFAKFTLTGFLLLLIAVTSDARRQQGKPSARHFGSSGGVHVHVLFTGICTLNHDNDTDAAVVSVSVPTDASTDRHHVAFIAADSHYNLQVAGGSWQKKTVPYDSGRKFVIYWLTGGSNIELKLQNVIGGVQHATELVPALLCADAANTSNLFFVPRLNRVLHGHVCSPNPDSYLKIGTRDVGDFRAFVVNPFLQQFEPELPDGKEVHHQQIAQLVDWDVAVNRVSGVPALMLSGSGVTVTADEYADDRTDTATIVVGSAPMGELEDAVKGGGRGGKGFVRRGGDPDFAHYYRGCGTPKPIPWNSTCLCSSISVPDYAPRWMRHVAVYKSRTKIRGAYIMQNRVIGGLNCGPDQQP